MLVTGGKDFFKTATRGFMLVEVAAAVGIFLLFALGVYGSIQVSSQMSYRSRMKIQQAGVLNEQLEIAKNISYGDVGVVGGYPAGVLPYQKTVTRDGATFLITTTVRNIDDPFDGTVASTTKDLAPADYKLVEMSIVCTSCASQVPVTLSARVAPKNLEGATNNGSLFINVFDVDGLPVSGANVQVINYNPNPDLVINDTTGIDGLLRIIDVPTGTLSYNISVSKAGYSNDYTATSSAQNPKPTKLPSTVISQVITEISFQIDQLAQGVIKTVRESCQKRANIPVALQGQKIIGSDPIVYKFKKNVTTDAQGEYALPELEPDTYTLINFSTAYDLIGTIPMSPAKVLPGSSQVLTVVLGPKSTHSLLVKVKDAGTGLPLSDATVELIGTNYSKIFTTSLGYVRQTDWSGSYGQADFTNSAKYWNDDRNVDVTGPAGDLKLKKIGMKYSPSAWLESSTIDVGAGATYRQLLLEPVSQPAQAGYGSLRVQLASATTSTPASWNFVGPDGTNNSFYTPTSTAIWSGHGSDEFVRYKVYVSTLDDAYTPQLSELALTFTSACTPPGQVYAGPLAAGAYTLTVRRAGYATNSGQIEVSGATETVITMSAN